MNLKWPHRKPAEAKSAELGIVLQDLRDHISVGTAVYRLHGVVLARCTACTVYNARLVYCLHGVQPAWGTACTAVHCALCAFGGLGLSMNVSKGPSLNGRKVPETQKEAGWSFKLVTENT